MSHARRSSPRLTLAVLSVGGLSFALLQSMVAPALPDIQHTLHTSESTVAWILTAYLLSASVATPIIGRLGDIHGKERCLVIVLVVLAAGTVLSALATSIGVMIVGRDETLHRDARRPVPPGAFPAEDESGLYSLPCCWAT